MANSTSISYIQPTIHSLIRTKWKQKELKRGSLTKGPAEPPAARLHTLQRKMHVGTA